jgi:hypothetical protein
VSQETKKLHALGGWALVGSGLLFSSRALLEFLAGPPPANGGEILAWVGSHALALSLANEALFFALMSLIPAVVALYSSLAAAHRAQAVVGCGIIGVVVPVLAMLDIVHGRLVFPVYGIHVTDPAVAELIVAVFYGGLHATDVLMAVATFVLSLAMRRSAYGAPVAYLGFATAVCDLVGAYPYLIGPIPTLGCQMVFAAWFVAVGWILRRME